MQWLASLGLILAAHAAAVHPAVAADRHQCATTRAAIQSAPAEPGGIDACDVDGGGSDDQLDSPVVLAGHTTRPPSIHARGPREIVCRSETLQTLVRFGPRPPPFSCSR